VAEFLPNLAFINGTIFHHLLFTTPFLIMAVILW
jgi:hypothetical protein